MSDARLFSPNYDNVRQVADAALLKPEGITIRFSVDLYTTYLNCEHAARRFQQTFTSLRARAARLNARLRGESETIPPRYSEAHGIYSNLVCQRSKFPPERVEVFLGPASEVMRSLVIVDNATGELLNLGAGESKWSRLAKISASHPERLTAEEYDYLADHSPYPNYWADINSGDVDNPWWPRPGGVRVSSQEEQASPSHSRESDHTPS